VLSFTRLAADIGHQPGEREHGRVDVAFALAEDLNHRTSKLVGVFPFWG
jgi:hypothetical protein